MAPVPGQRPRRRSPTPAGGSDVAHASFSPTHVSQLSRAEPSPSAQRASSAGTLGGSQRIAAHGVEAAAAQQLEAAARRDGGAALAHFGSSTHALGGRA